MSQANLTEAPKPRVFVSSVIEGFEAYRQQAREAILQAGGEPVLVNEDFPSHVGSSRNVCLDAIESCDLLVLLIGARGGWTTPSGKLVVEEEFEHARGRKIPVFVFLEDVQREDSAEAFARKVSDYVSGVFRTTFANAEELRAKVLGALGGQLLERGSMGIDKEWMDSLLKGVLKVQHHCVLRYVLLPVRKEEVIKPTQLSSDQFSRAVLEIGHSGVVDLLHYEHPTKRQLTHDSLLVMHGLDDFGRGARNVVQIEIGECGRIVIDTNVTGRRPDDSHSSLDSMFVMAAEDLEEALKRCCLFCNAFFEKYDPYGRHMSFFFDCVLGNVEHRKLERNPMPRSSYSTGFTPRESPLRLLPETRKISRSDLAAPETEIERVVSRWFAEVRVGVLCPSE